MATPAPIVVPDSDRSVLGHAAAFLLNTAIVYTFALQISDFLVGRWFAWFAPALQIASNVPPGDWYLQHLEVVTIIPAMMAGYMNVARFVPALFAREISEKRQDSTAIWAWSIPSVVLCYRMARYHAPSSVLIGSSMSAIKYFFDIQKFMPTTWTNLFANDPVRFVAQLTVTAPFYAGVAYSLGALTWKHKVLQNLFTFEKPEEEPTLPTDSTPERPSSSLD